MAEAGNMGGLQCCPLEGRTIKASTSFFSLFSLFYFKVQGWFFSPDSSINSLNFQRSKSANGADNDP